MSDYKQEFITFAQKYDALRFGDFTLKSGRQSPYFFNAGVFNTGKALSELGKFYAKTIIDRAIHFDMLYGPAYKGIPLVSTTAIALARDHDCESPYCFNRKEAKDHGEGGNIVGHALKGKVLLIDDVITAGTAVSESLPIIEGAGASLCGIIIMLDRMERGKGELSAIDEIRARYQIPVVSIINLDDIIGFLEKKSDSASTIEKILAYRKMYGARAS